MPQLFCVGRCTCRHRDIALAERICKVLGASSRTSFPYLIFLSGSHGKQVDLFSPMGSFLSSVVFSRR